LNRPNSSFGFGTSSSGGFGAQQGSPFGGTSSNPFGAPQASTGGGLFGQSSGFQNFGASQPSNAFGGGGHFGQSSSPSVFGSSQSSFGGGLFGQNGMSGGMPPPGATGTKHTPFQRTAEVEGTTTLGKPSVTVHFDHICAMRAYVNKTVEMLRYEDYSNGDKGSSGGPAATGFGSGVGDSPFLGGSTGSAASLSGFGNTGASSMFGASSSTPTFGASSSGPLFGGMSTPSGGAFGGFGNPSTAPAFSSTNKFSTGLGSNAFGQSQSSGFGGLSSSASFSSFGGFGTPSSMPAFGASSASNFGGGFGSSHGSTGSLFGGATKSVVGSATTPQPQAGGTFVGGGAFGSTTAASSTFGSGFRAPPAGGFASSGSSLFGTSSSGIFGASTGGGLSSFAPSQPSAFGSSSSSTLFASKPGPAVGGSVFGQPAPTGGFAQQGSFTGGFGGAQTGSLFGSVQPSVFGSSTAAPAAGFSFGLASQQQQQQQPLQQQQQPQPQASPHTSPYGTNYLPELPNPTPASSKAPETTGSGPVFTIVTPPELHIHRRLPLMLPPSTERGSRARFAARRRSGYNVRERRRLDDLFGEPFENPFDRGVENKEWMPPSMWKTDKDNPLELWDVKAHLPATVESAVLAPCGTSGAPEPSREITPEKSQGVRNGESQFLDEDEIVKILPEVLSNDYYTVPDSHGLKNMLRGDAHALKSLFGFTIGRKGYGKVKILESANVERAKICDIFQIRRGVVSAYENAHKKDVPAPGSGFNLPAEVTLHEVYKRKKDGTILRDPASQESFTRQLKKLCRRDGSQFVAYEADEGTWTFRVQNLC
ncbi:unnamed protein product, partial [Ostreobium quekettii]